MWYLRRSGSPPSSVCDYWYLIGYRCTFVSDFSKQFLQDCIPCYMWSLKWLFCSPSDQPVAWHRFPEMISLKSAWLCSGVIPTACTGSIRPTRGGSLGSLEPFLDICWVLGIWVSLCLCDVMKCQWPSHRMSAILSFIQQSPATRRFLIRFQSSRKVDSVNLYQFMIVSVEGPVF